MGREPLKKGKEARSRRQTYLVLWPGPRRWRQRREEKTNKQKTKDNLCLFELVLMKVCQPQQNSCQLVGTVLGWILRRKLTHWRDDCAEIIIPPSS